MPTQPSGSRTTSTARRLSILVLSCFLGATAGEAQSWTAPVTPELWNERLEIGPVPGLTTIWHQAPVRTAIPLGATVQLRTRIPMGWSVRWTGAREIERIPGWSTAEVEFRSLGTSTVSVAYDDGSGERIEEKTIFDVLNTTTDATVGFEPISVSALHLSADPVVIDPQDPNASSLNYFFRGSSVAALRQVGEGHYSTSTNRTLVLEAAVQPSGFSPLIEWRLDGVPQRQLGSPVHLEVYTAQPHVLSVGPPEEEIQAQLDTYMVRITSHQRADDIAEGVPVTFRAITDPPGYESDITWLASTKYGSADPWLGTGPELTVRFDGTVSAAGSWLGVRADNATLSLDHNNRQDCQQCFVLQKQKCDADQDPGSSSLCVMGAVAELQRCLAGKPGLTAAQQTQSACPDVKPQFFICTSQIIFEVLVVNVCFCSGGEDCERLKNSSQCTIGSFVEFGPIGFCGWDI